MSYVLQRFANVKDLVGVVHDTYYVQFIIEMKVLIVSYCLKCMEGVAFNVILHGNCSR